MAAADDEQTGTPASAPRTALVLLTLVYVLNYLDRQILGILSGPIQDEFHLTDTGIGLLNGPAFALTYAALGIPIAALADRLNRRNVVAASLAIFSAMTILCGYALNFGQLFLARFGTGLGEAGTAPATASILADLYPPERRATALSFYSAGLNIGLLLGFFAGGWIAEHYGWRNAFLAAGLPGFVLAAFLLFLVDEPDRGQAENITDRSEIPSFAEVLAWLRRRRSFTWFSFGAALSSIGGYAGIAFVPMFLHDSHHLSLPAIGLVLAVFIGGAGALGTWFAGVLADRLGQLDVRWNMYVPMLGWLVSAPFLPVFFLAPNVYVAIAAGTVPAFVGAVYVGPVAAMAQAVVPARMRVRAAAIQNFITNFIGLGAAAPLVGTISDYLKPTLGPDALRYALLASLFTGLLGVLCYWRACRTLAADIAAAHERDSHAVSGASAPVTPV
ncbi:MAG TPA: MFS transporter [Rhizomicrobium sp.]|nr:MFS transporter [Rhizomicrobium sp.]